MKNLEIMGVQEICSSESMKLNGGGLLNLLQPSYKIGMAMLAFGKGIWDSFNDGFSDGYLYR